MPELNHRSSSSNDDDHVATTDENGAAVGAWSLSIKTVGAEHSPSSSSPTSASSQHSAASSSSSVSLEKDFTIEVCPEDDIASLYELIETVTGLKASQQRLIYRGRLIGTGEGKQQQQRTNNNDSRNSNDRQEEKEHGQHDTTTTDKKASGSKIKDITGLCDGQTIHLVRRRERPDEEGNGSPSSANQNQSTAGSGDNNLTPGSGGAGNSNNGDGDIFGSSSSPSSVAPLLATLLGLGDDDSSSDRGGSPETAAAGRRSSWRSPRYGGNGGGGSSSPSSTRRGGGGGRPHYRLTADDLDRPDPGSMESVRQGMMTIHSSMLRHARAMAAGTENDEIRSPADTNRRWYIGQWIDCLDTVNQWLEATVTDIVHPDDVLSEAATMPTDAASPASSSPSSARRSSSRSLAAVSASASSSPFSDPVVTASDMIGRRRLLLEPCTGDDTEGDLGGELAGFRRRDDDDNDGNNVRLLLVHYNGWPHRWDEWIRSDSDRIRPFRVRTRHPISSSHASPTPQSNYAESPPTFIISRNNSSGNGGDGGGDEGRESADRAALLPELSRVLNAVNDLVAGAAASDSIVAAASANNNSSSSSNDEVTSRAADLPWRSGGIITGDEQEGNSAVAGTDNRNVSSRRRACQRRELEALAPLLDRLGRALVDSAPHVSALARSLTENAQSEESPELETIQEHPTSLGGLLSLLSRDRRRQTTTSSNVVVAGDSVSAHGSSVLSGTGTTVSEDEISIDPDMTDFASGVVNTTRGDVRRGPRSSVSSSDNDTSGLLGAYLAAASLGSLQSGTGGGGGNDDNDQNGGAGGLGRLLRDRGNGGGGIDIHIHAVVTAPGLPAGALGLAALGTPIATPVTPTTNDATPSTLFSSGRGRGSSSRQGSPRTPSVPVDDDDMGIFAELYSENPEPVDPIGTPTSEHSSTSDRRESRNEGRTSSSNHTPARSLTFSASGRSLTRSSTRGFRRSRSSREVRDRSSRRGGGGGGVFGRIFRRNESSG